jgi:hypothetical protein
MRVGSRVLVVVLVAAAVLVPLAAASSPKPSQSVIVVFKNQDRAQPATRAELGARRRRLAGIQGPVRQQLATGKARDLHSYTTLNAVSRPIAPTRRPL